jgi:phospholipid/cholesterol/gamma-HCH transport system permease protein
MKVTDQIDAIEASAVDPFRYLVATRVLACILMMPLLVLVCDACGILMGWVASAVAEPISLARFVDIGFRQVTFSDFLPSTFKTMVFGAIISVIACFQGMRATHGTRGVGFAATSSASSRRLVIRRCAGGLILVLFPAGG